MKEIYFDYNIDDIIKQLKKGAYSSNRDLLYLTSLGILSFYTVITLQGYRGKVFDQETYNKIAMYSAFGYGALGNVFINKRRKDANNIRVENYELMKTFLDKLEEIDIYSSETKVIESVKEKTKYKDLYYLFDNAGDMNILSKVELSKKKDGRQHTNYKKETINISDTLLEMTNTGVKEEFNPTEEEKISFLEKVRNKDFESIREEDYIKEYPYYIYRFDYSLDNEKNTVDFYLDKNRVRIIESTGIVSNMKEQMKYIYLKLALQETKEKDNMRVYEDAFKSKIIKKHSKVD